MFKKIPYRTTGIELVEHAHHMNPCWFYFPLHFVCEYHHWFVISATYSNACLLYTSL